MYVPIHTQDIRTCTHTHTHTQTFYCTHACSNVYDFRYTFMVDIVPSCTDDIVCLPKKVANSLGCISQVRVILTCMLTIIAVLILTLTLQLCLVYRVTNMVQVVDPTTLKTGNINALRWFHLEQNLYDHACARTCVCVCIQA